MEKLTHLSPILESLEMADSSLFNYSYQDVSGRLQKVLAFKAAESWEKVYLSDGSGQFSDEVNRVENGPLADQQFQLFYPGGDRPDLNALMNSHKVLRIKYAGQDPFIIGNPENPWLVTASFSLQKRGYTLDFVRKEAK